LQSKYMGPFRIANKISGTAYELDLPANFKAHPVINIEFLKEYHVNPPRFAQRIGQEAPTEPVWFDDGTQGFEVEMIRSHRKSKQGKISYLVKWRGYPDHDSTFEPEENLKTAVDALNEYWDALRSPTTGRRHSDDRRPITSADSRF
jgi:hypothetical protein